MGSEQDKEEDDFDEKGLTPEEKAYREEKRKNFENIYVKESCDEDLWYLIEQNLLKVVTEDEEMIRDFFRKYDTNNSGFLSKKEFLGMYEDMEKKFGDSKKKLGYSKELFEKYDHIPDGKLTFGEFKQAAQDLLNTLRKLDEEDKKKRQKAREAKKKDD